MIQEIEPIMNILILTDKKEIIHEYNLIESVIKSDRIICALKNDEVDNFLEEWIQFKQDSHYHGDIEKDNYFCRFKKPLRIMAVENSDYVKIITFAYNTMN